MRRAILFLGLAIAATAVVDAQRTMPRLLQQTSGLPPANGGTPQSSAASTVPITDHVGSECDGSVNCISSVDDTTPANGQSIRLTGVHFDDLDKADWLPFFTTNPTAWSFEGANLEADGYTSNGATYTSSVKLYGDKSFISDAHNTTTGPGQGGVYAHILNLDEDGIADWWIGVDAMWSDNGGGWANAFIKFLYNLGGGYYLEPGFGSSAPSTFLHVHDGANHSRSIPGGRLQYNRWYRFTVHWKQGQAPLVFSTWIDGVQMGSFTPRQVYAEQRHLLFGIVNWCCGTKHLTNWIDGLYVGTTQASVEAPARVFLDACGGLTDKKVWQPRTSVSATSITIAYTKGAQARGAKCLYVVNQAGVTSAGFPVMNP